MHSAFITFEGGEGAGKSTLIDRVAEALVQRRFPFIKTRAPGGTDMGRQVRELILHASSLHLADRAELFLFLADRAQHVKEVILPSLEKGLIVLCDRFHDSTIAYQAGARGLDETWVRELCHFASEGLHPSLTIFLDIPPELGLKRRSSQLLDKIEAEDLFFHQKIRQTYHKIAKREPRRFILIDATMSEQEVAGRAIQLVEQYLKE
jgi:dTMP kinase